VPKVVDHEQRRRQIAEALLRVAAERGLHNAGMREVAEAAGMSVRLIQYYFGTKEQLLLFTTQYLAERWGQRAMARIRARAGEAPAGPRTVIEAILAEGLPDDEDSRSFLVVYKAYFALSLTDPALDIKPLAGNSDALIRVIADQLRAARDAGRLTPGCDPDTEALSLITMSAGLGDGVLGGSLTPERARAVIAYHLDRLLPS
jgi:AcrR family transcriptional regulator